jgi:hypothetical protein
LRTGASRTPGRRPLRLDTKVLGRGKRCGCQASETAIAAVGALDNPTRNMPAIPVLLASARQDFARSIERYFHIGQRPTIKTF